MKILLHVCCAPDATTAYLRLSKDHDVTFYFYNPNIHPKEEYEKRLEAARKLASVWKVPMIEGEYEPEEYFEAVKGYENLGERSYRCFLCMRQRLMKTARVAKELGFDAFSTSLPTSPKKDFDMILRAGEEASKAFGIDFIIEDFKKEGGYPLSVRFSKELGLYRQNYCGCIFSLKEAMKTREESRRRKKEELEKLLRDLGLNLDFEMDPEKMEIDDDLIERMGIENLGKILRLIRPRTLVVNEHTYEKYWNGKKNARFGKFKVRLKVKSSSEV